MERSKKVETKKSESREALIARLLDKASLDFKCCG